MEPISSKFPPECSSWGEAVETAYEVCMSSLAAESEEYPKDSEAWKNLKKTAEGVEDLYTFIKKIAPKEKVDRG